MSSRLECVTPLSHTQGNLEPQGSSCAYTHKEESAMVLLSGDWILVFSELDRVAVGSHWASWTLSLPSLECHISSSLTTLYCTEGVGVAMVCNINKDYSPAAFSSCSLPHKIVLDLFVCSVFLCLGGMGVGVNVANHLAFFVEMMKNELKVMLLLNTWERYRMN